MTSIAFQLYSLHAVDDPLASVIDRVGTTVFEGIEFAGLDDADPAGLAGAVEAAGLAPAGAHVGLDEIERDPDAVAETYRTLGCEDVVVPWLDPEHFASAAAVETAGERLTAAADALADRGLRLHYHNHDQEFVDLDGRPALTHLIEATDGVGVELDLGWAGAAGYDPLAYLERHAERVDIVHLKDYDAAAGEPVVCGEGDLDLDATVDAVRDHGVDWLVYEAEEAPDSYDTLAHADRIVTEHW
ncbi:sugar phosphate isomerase/epimerase family protein [Halobaculum lipolyticum]|uniref:Sugar phosphate isomerase/epimerase family protein n=1 Tax=Halobaculum lipolyticum TaxID=3032001 RepID=A0ABD5W6G7_9EURY|nr:sugar phosphate isomerase/epimerase [Halobaculum sp. DT31]